MPRRALLAFVLFAAAFVRGAAPAPAAMIEPLADPDGAIARAAISSLPDGAWYGIDGHVHTDHSHDAGIFHQQDKRPENHDTDVRWQATQAAAAGMSFLTMTDHRTYDQAYDPEYVADGLVTLDGEEWGGYPHATAWGITETLEQGPDEGVCGVARASREVRAQDGIYGVAHPEDGRRACIDTDTLRDTPIDHLEAFRAPHTTFWVRNIAADRRLVPVTGSDNHFMQVSGTEGGVGGNTTFVYATARTHAAFVDGVRAGRVISTTRITEPRITTLLDADGDADFEAVTGGWSQPSGETVRVAFRVELGARYWLQVLDERNTVLAQEPITQPDQVLAFDLPATASLYRGQVVAHPLERTSGGEILTVHDFAATVGAYIDSLRTISAPVYLSAPTPVENGSQATEAGPATAPAGDVPFAGFPAVARSGDAVHVVWVQRASATYELAYARSADAGASWTAPVVLRAGARMPSIAADGQRVVIAFEEPRPERHAATIRMLRSTDGGSSFAISPEPLSLHGARPAIATAAGVDHVVWSSMEDGYKIRYARSTAPGSATLLSSATTWEGPLRPFAVPAAPIRHVPAAIHATIAVDGGTVAVAWDDNREDPTPLRNGTPDDWGIYGAVSADGGQTWSADKRISPRFDAKPHNVARPEDMVGHPARHPDLLFHGGSLVLAYQHAYPTGSANVYVQRSADGLTWTAPSLAGPSSAEFSYRPQLSPEPDGLHVVWQQSSGSRWRLERARSTDGGLTWSAAEPFTTGTGYAGYPATARGVAVWTGEQADVYRVFSAPL